MVEHQPSKLDTWVRFPSPAFIFREAGYFRASHDFFMGIFDVNVLSIALCRKKAQVTDGVILDRYRLQGV